MSGFLFAFLATLLATLGARDQLLVAALVERQGARAGLLLAGAASAWASAAFAAWIGSLLAAEVPGNARLVFAAMALGLAGMEALLPIRMRAPEEPTLSVFAVFAVLAARQVTDAARFIVLALALLSDAPIAAGLGGAASGTLALGAAWLAPELARHRALPLARRMAGGLLLAVGALLAWHGIG